MDEKTIEFLERAAGVFLKYGIKSVTMDDLARELGISKKTIYQHFKDKSDLIAKIIEIKVAEDQQVCTVAQKESENAIDEMLNITRFVVDNFASINPTVFYDLQRYHPDAWQIVTRHKKEFILTIIRNNIKRGIEEGVYRNNLNIEITARLHMACTDIIMTGDWFPYPEFRMDQLFIESIRFQIRGMATEKGRIYLKTKMNQITEE